MKRALAFEADNDRDPPVGGGAGKQGIRLMEAGRIVVRLDVMLARRKMTGRDLAGAVGISEQNISLLRAGRVKGIRFETLARICRVLECTPGDLLEVDLTDE